MPLCRLSSSQRLIGRLRLIEGAVSEHGEYDTDSAMGKGDDGLIMAFALVAFAVVVDTGNRVGS